MEDKKQYWKYLPIDIFTYYDKLEIVIKTKKNDVGITKTIISPKLIKLPRKLHVPAKLLFYTILLYYYSDGYVIVT